MQVENQVLPTAERAMAFFGGAEDGPFVMVNLLKFHDRAQYEDGDRGLSELGRRQALTAAEGSGLPADTVIWSSDFSRARQTAESRRGHA